MSGAANKSEETMGITKREFDGMMIKNSLP